MEEQEESRADSSSEVEERVNENAGSSDPLDAREAPEIPEIHVPILNVAVAIRLAPQESFLLPGG